MEPLVSIIIPTVSGEEQKVKQCVISLEASSYKNVEIIIVNEGKERSAQRNIGIRRAKGDFLLILDSDQFVSSGLIEECVALATYCEAIYIPEKIVTPGFFGYLRNWERGFYSATAIDVVRFLRKSICVDFDENMSGPEDSDWDRRIIGRKTECDNFLYHDDGVSFTSYLKKKIYYTKSMMVFERRNPKDKVLDWKWRCFGVFFEDGHWLRVLKRPDLFICLMGLIFVRGIIYHANRNNQQ